MLFNIIKRECGLTLIEILISIFLISIIASAVVPMLVNSYLNLIGSWEGNEDIRAAQDRLEHGDNIVSTEQQILIGDITISGSIIKAEHNNKEIFLFVRSE